jgi:hypothetical protein
VQRALKYQGHSDKILLVLEKCITCMSLGRFLNCGISCVVKLAKGANCEEMNPSLISEQIL